MQDQPSFDFRISVVPAHIEAGHVIPPQIEIEPAHEDSDGAPRARRPSQNSGAAGQATSSPDVTRLLPEDLSVKPPEAEDDETTADLMYRRLGWIADWQYEWRQKLEAVRDAAENKDGDDAAVIEAVEDAELIHQICSPAHAASVVGYDALLGARFQQLLANLGLVSHHWPHPSAAQNNRTHYAAAARSALHVLYNARRHLAFFAVCRRIRVAKPGEPVVIPEVLEIWNRGRTREEELVDPVDISKWLTREAHDTMDPKLQFEMDPDGTTAYRKPLRWASRLLAASAAVWGAIAGFGILLLLFAILDQAGIKQLPDPAAFSWRGEWVLQFAVLYGCVILGAALHVGAKALSSIKFEDQIKIYRSAGWWDWMAMRWVGVLRLFVPVIFVTATLWAADNVPTSMQEISLAILAGFSADSLMRAGIAKMDTSASTSQDSAKSGAAQPA